jgi:hypothetical protein
MLLFGAHETLLNFLATHPVLLLPLLGGGAVLVYQVVAYLLKVLL